MTMLKELSASLDRVALRRPEQRPDSGTHVTCSAGRRAATQPAHAARREHRPQD